MTEVRASFSTAVLVLALCAGSAALAQGRARTPQDQAREQYQRGVVAYNLERFDEAIAAFTRAYELDPAPTLLYNIAQSRWKKGEIERALFYYRRYLEADPAAANRPAVEARIKELEAARHAPPPPPAPKPEPAAAPAAPAAPVEVAAPPVFVQASPPPPERPIYKRPWFWGAVAVAAAATVIAVVLIASPDKGPGGCGSSECKLGMVTVPAP